jgi:hypothetical protein
VSGRVPLCPEVIDLAAAFLLLTSVSQSAASSAAGLARRNFADTCSAVWVALDAVLRERALIQ